MAKKAVMIIAFQGFRDEEYLEPKAVLEQAGIAVATASTEVGVATGKLGAQVKTDMQIKDVAAAEFDAIIFVGGPGSYSLFENPDALKLAQEAIKLGKVLGGICAAAAILAHAGVLKGIKATSFSGVADILRENGANYSALGLEVDGKIVTADGPSNAKGFGEEIVRLL